MSKQRTRKFVTKILRKTCSPLVEIIFDKENNFRQNKYNKLQKIFAKNNCFFPKIIAKVQIWDHLQLNYMVFKLIVEEPTCTISSESIQVFKHFN